MYNFVKRLLGKVFWVSLFNRSQSFLSHNLRPFTFFSYNAVSVLDFHLGLIFLFPRAPRFKGYQQQDSQELLHYLLDSIRVEETKVSLHVHHIHIHLYLTTCDHFKKLKPTYFFQDQNILVGDLFSWSFKICLSFTFNY